MEKRSDAFIRLLTNTFSRKNTSVALPPIAPLETKAEITDTLEAVERFPACLLVTDPILSDEIENYTIKEVVFDIKSNDQGWSSGDNFEGEYENSQTWFDVAILRPVKEDVRTSPRDRQRQSGMTSEPCIKKYLDERTISNKLCFVISPNGSPLWHLQRNRRGNDEPFAHTIIWTRNCKELEDERRHFDAKTGTGSGVNFVQALQRGDRVALIARAKQSGSVNYISEARIRIFFEGFEFELAHTLTASSTEDLNTQSHLHTLRSSPPRERHHLLFRGRHGGR